MTAASRQTTVFALTTAVLILAGAGCLLAGAADIPPGAILDIITGHGSGNQAWDYIVLETRLPALATAALAGMALSVAGLLMQTTFDNPLAGPSILGISAGSSLGVAIVIMALGAVVGLWSRAAVVAGALAGALAVMMLLTVMSALLRSSTMLLIVGILIGYLASSAISLLNFFATRESVHTFVIWGLGSFGGVTSTELPAFAALTAAPALLSALYAKALNALLLGERYAASAGVSIRATRRGLLLLSGALTAVVTAWCGPVGFIGLIVPHIARLALHTSDHRRLLPASALIGAAVGVVCLLACIAPGPRGIIPLNAVTPVIGVPVIIYIIVRRRSIFYFN